jgi:hypothetical protein
MNILTSVSVLAFGSMLLVGCGAQKDESAAQTNTPAAEAPASSPEDAAYPADETGTMPSDEADPAMSDTLPTAEQPPPTEPAPPPNN